MKDECNEEVEEPGTCWDNPITEGCGCILAVIALGLLFNGEPLLRAIVAYIERH